MELPRPRDLALLLLASGDASPRQRARDQQADRAGLALKRRMLERLADLDPEPAELETALLDIVGEIGEPDGPPRAIAMSIRDEWATACATPAWIEYLLEEAVRGNEGGKRGGRIS